MVGFILASCAGLLLYLKFNQRKSDGMDRMFTEEMQKIKNDSVVNFIDKDFGRKNFEMLKNAKFSSSSHAANDERRIHFPITSLQDLVPQDLA